MGCFSGDERLGSATLRVGAGDKGDWELANYAEIRRTQRKCLALWLWQ